jgi:hypothetical protein
MPAEWLMDTEHDEFDSEELLYLKYCFEGHASLGQLASALLELAVVLEAREGDGWTLAHPVDSGWVCLKPPDE